MYVPLGGAPLVKIGATLPATLVSENVALNAPTRATTVKAPAMTLAVNRGAVAVPVASVSTWTVRAPPGKAAEAPLAGAVKVTGTPSKG